MDTLAPASMIQNENLPIHKGVGGGGKEGAAKADVPRASKAGRRERKALRDLSLKPKRPPLPSSAAAATTTKSAARSRDAAAKSKILTEEEEEESDRCRTWAQEGVERMPYYDAQKHQREQLERRVEKKVQRAMADLRGWSHMTFFNGLGVPAEEFDAEDVLKLEVEPEVLLSRPHSRRTNLLLNSVDENIEDLLDLERIEDLHLEDLHCNSFYELRLKEEYV